MKVIFIYGPPGVGKLAVATALARLTGYKLYHNHLAIEAVLPIFDYGTKEFNRLINRYRLEMLDAAAASSLPGMVATFVYAKGADDGYLKILTKTVEKHGSKVFFVRLYCSSDELKKRLISKSRMRFSKIRSASTLARLEKKYDLHSTVDGYESFSIDNTSVPPNKAARMIKEHYKL
ncbi:MAG: AAA family ATPase [Candidatus Marsarchaeota archaeon]|jgi:deoxyadenosine/deoxycytidine kinase|nr:AAA family ATPase [Candidatus Marsarchaeota archaeon]MCL5112764.1 AAA family ATPase [Candidatus Marsarchaeota archaeon]